MDPMARPPGLGHLLRRTAFAQRWPWRTTALIAAAAAAVQWLHAAYSVFTFGNTDDDVYASWAARPVLGSSGGAIVILLAVLVPLSMRRWRPRARAVMLGVVLICAGAIDGIGTYETYARHHIRSELARAIATVPAPPGAVLGKPATVSDDGGDPLNGVPGEPVAYESWETTGGGGAACAAIRKAVAGQPGWRSLGDSEVLCEYRRVEGRAELAIRVDPTNDSLISVYASPNDEG